MDPNKICTKAIQTRHGLALFHGYDVNHDVAVWLTLQGLRLEQSDAGWRASYYSAVGRLTSTPTAAVASFDERLRHSDLRL